MTSVYRVLLASLVSLTLAAAGHAGEIRYSLSTASTDLTAGQSFSVGVFLTTVPGSNFDLSPGLTDAGVRLTPSSGAPVSLVGISPNPAFDFAVTDTASGLLTQGILFNDPVQPIDGSVFLGTFDYRVDAAGSGEFQLFATDPFPAPQDEIRLDGALGALDPLLENPRETPRSTNPLGFSVTGAATPIPEPAAFALLGIGLAALTAVRLRRLCNAG